MVVLTKDADGAPTNMVDFFPTLLVYGILERTGWQKTEWRGLYSHQTERYSQNQETKHWLHQIQTSSKFPG